MPKKRVQRKLTERLKQKIRSEHKKLKLADFDGDALSYLKKVRSLSKARKAKSDSQAKVEGLHIPKDSEAYRVIEAMAKEKKITVKQLIKKYRKEIEALLEDGGIVMQRETNYLITDLNKLPKGKKVWVNDLDGYVLIPKNEAILRLQMLMMHCAALTDIFMLIYRVEFKLDGDVRFYCPPQKQYENLIDQERITDFLDDYEPHIIYIISDRKAEA